MQSQTDTAGELNASTPSAAVNSGALPEHYELLNAPQAMRVGDFSVRMPGVLELEDFATDVDGDLA